MRRTVAMRWTTRIAGLAGAFMAVASTTASPVLDDEHLSRGFARKLGELADAGAAMEAAEAGRRLGAVAGHAAQVPPTAAARAIVPAGPLYDAVLPAVVAVGSVFKCDRCSQWHLGGMASGWVVTPDGLVVTNHHVLERDAGHRFGVMTSDGEVYAITDVVASNPDGDAAVVRIDTRGRELACLALGEPPACGADVSVVSHPKGRFWCLTEGAVSRYHRQRRRDRGPNGGDAVWMSVTADYAVGSSGGPVLDGAGRVVGMVSRTTTVTPRREPPGPANEAASAHPAPPEQMIFKDCVSADTLRAILGEAAGKP